MTADAALALAIPAAFLGLLVLLAGLLQAAELAFPALSRFLDRHVGEPRAFE